MRTPGALDICGHAKGFVLFSVSFNREDKPVTFHSDAPFQFQAAVKVKLEQALRCINIIFLSKTGSSATKAYSDHLTHS